MVVFERKVGPKGQVVIPEEIRKATGILPSSSVVITLEEDRVVIQNTGKDIVKKFAETAAGARHRGKIDFDREYDSQLAAAGR